MESNQQTTVIIVQSKKSILLGLILTFFFGPLGMLYSTIAGGVIMMILTPVVGFFTLGLGLLIMWPIQLIWSGVAISMHNKKCGNATVTTTSSSTSTPEPPKSVEDEKVHLSKKNMPHYDEANRLSDEKIKELLANRDELGADFVEALKFVNTERVMKKEAENSRKAAYDKALLVDDEERKNRIASPSLYSELSISALKYIQRCIECETEPNTTGFLATFDEKYVAPETPAEREMRMKNEQEQAERERKRVEEIAIAEAKQKKITIITLATIAVVSVVICIYAFLITPTTTYNEMVQLLDSQYENFDKTATLDNQKNELEALKAFYFNLSQNHLPVIKKNEKAEYISNQINVIDSMIADIAIQEARLKEEARLKAEAEAKKKADDAARQKAAAKQKAELIRKEKEARLAAGLYEIGDIYDKDGMKGIVISANGVHGKIILAKQWTQQRFYKEIRSSISIMPIYEEFKVLYKYRDLINENLKILNGDLLSGSYWVAPDSRKANEDIIRLFNLDTGHTRTGNIRNNTRSKCKCIIVKEY